MRFKSKVIYSGLISFGALIISILTPSVPCKIIPQIPNPTTKWTLCSLNPDTAQLTNSVRSYLGYTNSITETYFLILFLTFAISFIFLYFLTKSKKE